MTFYFRFLQISICHFLFLEENFVEKLQTQSKKRLQKLKEEKQERQRREHNFSNILSL
jgi:hypothetical protein